MQGEIKPGMPCAEFDALLAEAIDGTLAGEQLARFEQHRAECDVCGTIFAEASAGLHWLDELEEIEPPRHLVHNILAATSGVLESTEAVAGASHRSLWWRIREAVAPVVMPLMTPRFGMSMAMAFFSLTLVMNMTGLRVTDLTPHNLERHFYSSQAKVVKYYENIRLVYEIESRVRDLRQATSPEPHDKREPRPEPRSNREPKTSEPGQEEYQNYTRELNDRLMAAIPAEQYDLAVLRQRREA